MFGVLPRAAGRVEVLGFFRVPVSGLAAGLPRVPVLPAGGRNDGRGHGPEVASTTAVTVAVHGEPLRGTISTRRPTRSGGQRLGPGVAGTPSPVW